MNAPTPNLPPAASAPSSSCAVPVTAAEAKDETKWNELERIQNPFRSTSLQRQQLAIELLLASERQGCSKRQKSETSGQKSEVSRNRDLQPTTDV